MSRGFVKEDDQEDVPMVPPRAYLPPGVPNYVTRSGMDALLAERKGLLRERDELDSTNERERRIAVNHINARLQLLDNRIATAKIMEPGQQKPDEIRFGATVTIKVSGTEDIQTIQIVGVDEADIGSGRISFISPLAKALINKKAGSKAILKLPREQRTYDIISVDYR